MSYADHLYVRFGLYTHHGIDVGAGLVVHLSKQGGLSVALSPLDEFRRDSDGTLREVQVKTYGACDPDAIVVARARASVGRTGYHLFLNNCEHFATWCKTGHESSEQVNDLKAAGTGAASIYAATGKVLGTVAASGSVTGMSGAGIMSGLSGSAVLGGGAAGGLATLAVAPTAAAIKATWSLLPDDECLPAEERKARQAGRAASVVGGVGGIGGSIALVSASGSVAGLGAAGMTSGLAAIGGTFGGGMAAGVAATVAFPAVAAATLGYLTYKLFS